MTVTENEEVGAQGMKVIVKVGVEEKAGKPQHQQEEEELGIGTNQGLNLSNPRICQKDMVCSN